MLKRGQLSLFIIIGLILVGIVFMFIYFKGTFRFGAEEAMILPTKFEPLKFFVEDCLNEVMPLGFRIIGLQGGYVKLPKDSFITDKVALPYYYHEGKNLMPSLRDIENQISSYVNVALPVCVDDFSKFEDYNLEVEDLKVSSSVGDDKTGITVEYVVNVRDQGLRYSVPVFVEYPIRLGKMHQLSGRIVDDIIKDPGYIDMTLLSEQEMPIVFLPYDDKIGVYSITDYFNDEEYIFMFAYKLK